MHPKRTDRDGGEIHLSESGNCCMLEGSMSNCYATIHPNDAKLRGGFLPKHLSLLDHSFRLSTAVCLSHFSVACLVTQASSGRDGVIFQCFLEDAEVSVAFPLFLSDQICARGVYVRIEGFARNLGANLLIKSDTRMDKSDKYFDK